jgi:hypothetical protein
VTTIFNQHEGTARIPVSPAEVQESIRPFPHETNITDGGEFLDDAIRMKDQPIVETNEKSLQKGSYKHLF